MQENKERYVSELSDLLRIPSISADPKYKGDCKKTAEFIAASLKKAGCKTVKIYPTDGHPVVYGEHITDKSKPTVLVYGHYDVQPPEPLELWNSPPFTLTRAGDHLYARGVSDDKGQLILGEPRR